MSQNLELARQQLLAPTGLDESSLGRVLSSLMQPGIDAADLYFQAQRTEHWGLEEGIVKSGSHQIGHGVGVRAVSGEKQGGVGGMSVEDAQAEAQVLPGGGRGPGRAACRKAGGEGAWRQRAWGRQGGCLERGVGGAGTEGVWKGWEGGRH